MEKTRLLDNMLAYNEKFVEEKRYEEYETTKFPNKKMVILTCMDTRLLELLPKAINASNGDIKLVKNAGALIMHPFGSIMRSILVAVYELQAEEVMIIGHYDCGMSGMKADPLLEKMKSKGIAQETFETLSYSGINVFEWLEGFTSVKDSVAHSVDIVKKHPLMPKDIPVHGLVIDPKTGKLDLVINGYND
ncbi:beta-class carbonic anhydrase [Neobacillus sp. D3-1R]|uniref:beta-class carbonic anhydrase n=1 Tax=Neobacillus sp. D3-1R TaxID=3445778 RepID=UPI003F9F7FC6